MNGAWTLIAIAATLIAIGRLAVADPKRRRVFRLPPRPVPLRPLPAWGLVLAPGLILAALGTPADVVIWCGATTAAGWALAAVPPPLAQRLMSAVAAGRWRRHVARLPALVPARRALVGMARRADPPTRTADASGTSARVAALEARLAVLEAELAALQARPSVPAPAPASEPRLHAVETHPPTRAAGPR
ncbi:hypothetical protein C882_3600 [Caenispirillum salinarum AK4]|uniref:Uncharacterized protein n=1 Tax=Caenispirillum salinarum AK4 TaxID=1238182 RepID=K9HNE0_9PROT|nr:hypothetical protein [Caenispirillum salinarum]EKV31848.1 hypothetical protein C882_3600 [Caenispirillum salinarum AK4]